MDSIEWNSRNVPMRSYDPLPAFTLDEYDAFLRQFLRRWLRHNERFERHMDEDEIAYTIFRDELVIGRFELGYPFGKPYLALGTHKMVHEQAIEKYSRNKENWPPEVRESADRMLFFYFEVLRTLRELEDSKAQKVIPTITYSLEEPGLGLSSQSDVNLPMVSPCALGRR
jgi:hypothetical protein